MSFFNNCIDASLSSWHHGIHAIMPACPVGVSFIFIALIGFVSMSYCIVEWHRLLLTEHKSCVQLCYGGTPCSDKPAGPIFIKPIKRYNRKSGKYLPFTQECDRSFTPAMTARWVFVSGFRYAHGRQ